MDWLLSFLPRLGLAGMLFVAFMLVAQLGLTQFAKDVVKAIFKRRVRPPGCTDTDWSEQQDMVKRWMVWCISLAIGALLGAFMLAPVARLLELSTPDPWGGVLSGVVLAAIVSGLVSFYQQRTEEAGRANTEGMAAILAQISAVQAQQPPVQVQTPGPVTVGPVSPGGSAVVVPAPTEELRPITPEEVTGMTRMDWPAVPVDDPPLDRG